MTSTLHRFAANETARQRLESDDGGAFLACQCADAVFLHFAIDPAALQPHVPYALATHHDLAYVSICTMTVRAVGMVRGDARAPWRLSPLHGQPLVQVRTPVEHGGEPGFYLLEHMLDHAVEPSLGEARFGLCRRFARLDLRPNKGETPAGRIVGSAAFRYQGRGRTASTVPAACEPESLDAFLIERFTAFTRERCVHRLIRCWHQPWRVLPMDLQAEDQGLLGSLGSWASSLRYCGGHWAPGVQEVLIGRPQWVAGPGSCWD